MKNKITEQEIASMQSPNGGWSRKQLAKWGVPWPPPSGWKREILTNGIPYSEVIEIFGGGSIVAQDKPLFCKHCDGDLFRDYQQLYATAPVQELAALIEKRCGKIVEAVWPNGSREWRCNRCGRKVENA